MARARSKPEEAGGPGFLTTYADIVTLLMAFFVLLFAISSIDEQKFLSLLKGLEADFGNTAYDDLIIDGGAGLLGSNQPTGTPIPVPGGTLTAEPLAAVHELSTLAAYAEDASAENADRTTDEIAEAIDEVPLAGRFLDYEQLLEVATKLQEVAVERSLTGAIELGFNERGLVVVLTTDGVLFDSGSAALKADLASEVLAPIAAELATFDNNIFIEGHTDDVPLDRAGYNNWDLSTDRALAVLDYFELDAGIDPHRLAASGFGEYRPLAEGASPIARQRNRRVEIVIAFGSDPVGPLQPLPTTTEPFEPAPAQDPFPYGTPGIF